MRRALAAGAFTAVVWRTLVRDRTALFFMLVLPVAVIVIIGTTFGGQGRTEIGLVAAERGPLAARVSRRAARRPRACTCATTTTSRRCAAPSAAQTVAAGVVLPRGLDAELRAGRQARLRFVAAPDSEAALAARRDRAGDRRPRGRPDRRRPGAATTSTPRLALATAQAGNGVTVAVQDVGEARVRELSRFSLTAPQNLVLFVFINAMASAVLIVAARRQGILRRALAAPVPMAVILIGLGARLAGARAGAVAADRRRRRARVRRALGRSRSPRHCSCSRSRSWAAAPACSSARSGATRTGSARWRR